MADSLLSTTVRSRLDSLGIGPDAPTDAPTVAETFRARGLGWGVKLAEVYDADGEPIERIRAIRRDDTGGFLGCVSRAYAPLPNPSLASMLDSAIGSVRRDYGDRVRLGTLGAVTAGDWGGGRRVFARLDLGRFDVGGEDTVVRQALIIASHDGSGSVRIVPITTRLFCANQVPGLMRQSGIRIRHSAGSVGSGLDRVLRLLLGVAEVAGSFDHRFASLGSIPADSSWLRRFFLAAGAERLGPDLRATFALGDPGPHADADRRSRWDAAQSRLRSVVDDIASRFEHMGAVAPGIGGGMPRALLGTRWHALNAATESLEYAARSTGESRADGGNAARKAGALALAESVN